MKTALHGAVFINANNFDKRKRSTRVLRVILLRLGAGEECVG